MCLSLWSLHAFWQMQLEQGTFPSGQDTNLCQASKFQVSGDQAKCLNLLSGMNSCTSDIVDFLSDRLTNLGPGCCGSISTITKNCLPSTLASFGFTSEQHNKLQEHCHAMSGLATAPIGGLEAPLANY